MTTIRRFLATIRSLLTNPKALVILAVLYALLLATLYGFISIREATVWQVVLTMLFFALIPIEFFVLQAAILQHARAEKFRWAQIGPDAIKLAVVSIPIIALGCVLYYLLNKWQAHYLAPEPILTFPDPKAPPAPQPLHWPTVLFATVRLLLLGVALPLATIHLWIEVAARDVRASLGGGAKTVLKRIGNALARAFEFDSVLTYALGLIVFVLVPYAILFVPPVKGTKTDFTLFVLRLVLVYAFTLIGWTVTLMTLARSTSEASPTVPVSTVPNAPAEAPA